MKTFFLLLFAFPLFGAVGKWVPVAEWTNGEWHPLSYDTDQTINISTQAYGGPFLQSAPMPANVIQIGCKADSAYSFIAADGRELRIAARGDWAKVQIGDRRLLCVDRFHLATIPASERGDLVMAGTRAPVAHAECMAADCAPE